MEVSKLSFSPPSTMRQELSTGRSACFLGIVAVMVIVTAAVIVTVMGA